VLIDEFKTLKGERIGARERQEPRQQPLGVRFARQIVEADGGAPRLDREASLDLILLHPFARRLHHAMHVAAASPVALDAAGLDPATVKRERAVLAEKNAGKPANVLEKIVESGLKTYYKEVCLLDQAYVHDPAKTVAQAIKEAEKTVGAPVAITGFVRYALGEGVEKPVEEAS